MTDQPEVEVIKALFDKVVTFANAQDPVLSVAFPNVAFVPPAVTKTVQWLRVTLMPADSEALGIAYGSTDMHYGLLQIDVMQAIEVGELAPSRLAASLALHFARGTRMVSGGYAAKVYKRPYRGPLIMTAPWVQVPLRVPYQSFVIPA